MKRIFGLVVLAAVATGSPIGFVTASIPPAWAQTPAFDDTEAQLRVRQTANAASATARKVEALRKELDVERQRVVQSDSERELNQAALRTLAQEVRSAETKQAEQDAALKAAQAARTAGLAGEVQRRKTEDGRRPQATPILPPPPARPSTVIAAAPPATPPASVPECSYSDLTAPRRAIVNVMSRCSFSAAEIVANGGVYVRGDIRQGNESRHGIVHLTCVPSPAGRFCSVSNVVLDSPPPNYVVPDEWFLLGLQLQGDLRTGSFKPRGAYSASGWVHLPPRKELWEDDPVRYPMTEFSLDYLRHRAGKGYGLAKRVAAPRTITTKWR